MANISKYIKSLKTVATTGSYNDLINKPTLGTAAALNVGTNANEILQLNSQGKIPSVDGSLLINILASEVSPAVPYSVISAKTSSGVASFITKTSNTQIVFDTNSGGIPIKICYPDGSVESNSSLTGISGISTDGTYYVIKEKNLNPYITTLIPIESYVAPTTPATNQLWLDLSVIPYVPKKWNGSSWVVTQFVKLGEFVRTSGIIGTPTCYALNGKYIIDGLTTNLYAGVSGQTSSYDVYHNLGTGKTSITIWADILNLTIQMIEIKSSTMWSESYYSYGDRGIMILQAGNNKYQILMGYNYYDGISNYIRLRRIIIERSF